MKPVRRLQRELNLRLMLPVLAIVVLTGLIGIFGAEKHVEQVFDRWLLDAAHSLKTQVRFVDGRAFVELSQQSEALLIYDIVDRTFFEVVQRGHHVLGQIGIPTQGEREHSYGSGERVYDARFAGKDVRVAWIPVTEPSGNETAVVVAETLTKRQRARSDLLLTMSPAIVLVLAAVFSIGLVVQRTIRSLESIASRWNERLHESLNAVPINDVPSELMPFATALNELLRRVRETMLRERRFATTVAHQLLTPLTGLRLGMARAAEAPDADSMRAMLNDLDQSTQRVARLIQQLLAFSRLEPEAWTGLRLVDVDLVALVREVGETYQDAALAKNIQLELIFDEATTVIHGQPELLSEALGNLIDNAVRYTMPGGCILISVRTSPASIEVADSGPGVPEEERFAVFERFVRGRSASGEGSGLGLAIVKEIAALHGTQVSLARSDLGGAKLTLRFN